MLTSANNFLYTYLLFLIGKYEFNVERNALRSVIGKWFFMSSLTGRYTGSPETILETDLRRLDQSEKTEAEIEEENTVPVDMGNGQIVNVKLPKELMYGLHLVRLSGAPLLQSVLPILQGVD